MDATLFLEQFGHLAQSQGGISKLRKLILDLAVRGKLVEQNPEDEPASELLKRIETKDLSVIDREEIPYNLPDGWAWVRLGELCEVISGSTPKSLVREYWEGNIVWITPTDLGRLNGKYINSSERMITPEGYASCSVTLMPAGSVVMSSRAPIGHLGIANTELCTNQGCKSFIPSTALISDYLYYTLKAFVDVIKRLGTGTTFTEVSKTKLIPFLIPLPPLAEQEHIVAKVDELMALCDQMEAEQQVYAELRQQSSKSILSHLANTSNHLEAYQYWQSAQDNFAQVFNTSATVADLRAAILQLAVQGRLVPQNPEDEPASELLKQIETEKHRLIQAGEIRPSKPLPSIREDEIPYEVPQGWVWARVNEIGHNWGQKKPDKTFTYIDVGSIDQKHGMVNSPSVITSSKAPSRARKIVKRGTVIYATVRPYLLNIAIINNDYDPEPIASTAFAIIHPYKGVLASYIYYYLRCPEFIGYVEGQMKGMAYPAINDSEFFSLPFPIPPLNEQERIIAKVDELMGLCDQLEVAIQSQQSFAGELFDAIVYEMLDN